MILGKYVGASFDVFNSLSESINTLWNSNSSKNSDVILPNARKSFMFFTKLSKDPPSPLKLSATTPSNKEVLLNDKVTYPLKYSEDYEPSSEIIARSMILFLKR